MTDKTLIGIGAAAIIVPLASFVYFGGFRSQTSTPAPKAALSKSEPAHVAKATLISSTQHEASPTLSLPEAAKLTDAQRHVTPVTLEDLAQSVQLDGNAAQKSGNKKEMWAQALPVAQALVQHSDADCEQHNWLVRFVECGQQALADSPDYYNSANTLASMPRDQQEAQTGLPSN